MSDDAPTGDPAADAGIPPAPTPPAPAPARAAPPAQAAPAPAAQAPAATGSGLSLADQGITPQSIAAAMRAQGQQDQPRHVTDGDRDWSRQPKWAQDDHRRVRDEAAGYRVRLREAEESSQQLLRTIADSAGLDVSEVNVDSLQDLFGYAAAAAQRAEVTQAALVAAVEHGLDPAALLKWQPFLDAADALDPTADDFRTSVGSLVRDTGESTPILRAFQSGQEPARNGPARSGAPIPGGSGNQPSYTMDDVNAMAADGQFERIDQLRREGKLSHLI